MVVHFMTLRKHIVLLMTAIVMVCALGKKHERIPAWRKIAESGRIVDVEFKDRVSGGDFDTGYNPGIKVRYLLALQMRKIFRITF